MTHHTYFRVDRFNNAHGSFIGIYADRSDAMLEIDGKPVGDYFDQSGGFYQLTTFQSPCTVPSIEAWEHKAAAIYRTEYFD